MQKPASAKTISEKGKPAGPHDADRVGSGAGYAVGAYLFWGVAPVYFVWVQFAHPLEVLSHRIVWSVPLLAGLITLTRQWPELFRLQARQLRLLMLASALLTINWLTFIYAVQTDRITETSLGYYINPLVSIVLGWLFLREKLRPWQWASAAIAAAGVMGELLARSELPWLGLVLAGSFGIYGMVRHQLAIPSSVGLGVETCLMAPLAVGYLVYFAVMPDTEDRSIEQILQLGLGGMVTVTPLILFGAAAIRLRLSTLGFFQYIAPTLSLLLAVYVYGEQVSSARWMSFVLIWVALFIFTMDAMYHHHKYRRGR